MDKLNQTINKIEVTLNDLLYTAGNAICNIISVILLYKAVVSILNLWNNRDDVNDKVKSFLVVGIYFSASAFANWFGINMLPRPSSNNLGNFGKLIDDAMKIIESTINKIGMFTCSVMSIYLLILAITNSISLFKERDQADERIDKILKIVSLLIGSAICGGLALFMFGG